MFSENDRISEKQLRRTLVLPVFASCIFVLPHVAAKMFGSDMVWGMFVFFMLAVVYCAILYWIGKGIHENEKQSEVEKRTVGRKAIAILSMGRLTVRLAFYILLAVTILGEAQVPFMRQGGAARIANLVVLLPLLLVALYGANHRMEKVVRIHEMVFWVTFVPFVIMIVFGICEVNWKVWIPEAELPLTKMLLYGYFLLTLVLPVENYLQLKKAYNKRITAGISYSAVLSVILLAAVLSMLIVGIYGIRGAAGDEMVTISIMRYIRLPLGVLERFDILMIWFFMTGCFVLICSTLFFIRQTCYKTFEGKHTWWLMLLALVLGLFMVYRFPKYEVSLMLFLWYGAWVDLPLSILLPLLERWICNRRKLTTDNKNEREEKKIRKRHLKEAKKYRRKRFRNLNGIEKLCMWLFMGCFCCMVLTGCGSDMRNVEQRDYATVLLVSREHPEEKYHIYLGIARERKVGEKSQVEELLDFKVSDFSELKKEYESQRGKNLSLMHVKVIFWDMEAREELTDFLYELDEEEEIAKTCPVLWISDKKQWLSYMEDSEMPIGTYVSNLVQEFDKGKRKVPWLKDYLKYIREGEELYPCGLYKASEGWKIQFTKTRYQFPNVE